MEIIPMKTCKTCKTEKPKISSSLVDPLVVVFVFMLKIKCFLLSIIKRSMNIC